MSETNVLLGLIAVLVGIFGGTIVIKLTQIQQAIESLKVK